MSAIGPPSIRTSLAESSLNYSDNSFGLTSRDRSAFAQVGLSKGREDPGCSGRSQYRAGPGRLLPRGAVLRGDGIPGTRRSLSVPQDAYHCRGRTFHADWRQDTQVTSALGRDIPNVNEFLTRIKREAPTVISRRVRPIFLLKREKKTLSLETRNIDRYLSQFSSIRIPR